MSSSPKHVEIRDPAKPVVTIGLAVRCAIGGILMGLANLVPGISGGTMLLASGVYPDFVDSVAAITTLRRRLRPWLIALLVGVPAVVAIGLLAATVRDSVLQHRWIAYSLFIGLTLGGVPLLWRMVQPVSRKSMIGFVVALILMSVLVVMQQTVPTAGEGRGGIFGLFIASFLGSTAMVLPGVSGGYLLLLMGQYVPMLDAISAFTDAAKAGDSGAFGTALIPIIAIGAGFGVGVVVVSNLIRWLLKRHREATLGALLGLLVGAVLGLWPFREAVEPVPGIVVRGVVIENESQAREILLKHWPIEHFTPDAAEVFASVTLVVVGFGICWAIGLIGRETETGTPRQESAQEGA